MSKLTFQNLIFQIGMEPSRDNTSQNAEKGKEKENVYDRLRSRKVLALTRLGSKLSILRISVDQEFLKL